MMRFSCIVHTIWSAQTTIYVEMWTLLFKFRIFGSLGFVCLLFFSFALLLIWLRVCERLHIENSSSLAAHLAEMKFSTKVHWIITYLLMEAHTQRDTHAISYIVWIIISESILQKRTDRWRMTHLRNALMPLYDFCLSQQHRLDLKWVFVQQCVSLILCIKFDGCLNGFSYRWSQIKFWIYIECEQCVFEMLNTKFNLEVWL